MSNGTQQLGRRHASAAPTATAKHGTSPLGRASLAILAALCAALLLSASALAAAPEFVSTFTCSVATPCGSFESMKAERIAIDSTSGFAYVNDQANDAVEVFSSSGAFLGQLLGSQTTAGDFNLAAGEDNDIAVDNSEGPNQGNLYVLSEGHECGARGGSGICGIFAFDNTGQFLWEKPLSSDPCGVAVDPSGNLWTADWENGVQKRSTADGSAIGSAILAGSETCEMDFNSQSDLYVRKWGEAVGTMYRYASPAYSAPGILIASGGRGDIAISRASDQAFIASFLTDTVSVYDSANNPVSGSPFDSGIANHDYIGTAINDKTNQLYVTDEGLPAQAHPSAVEIFALPFHSLTVTPAGGGSGTVSADKGPISGCSSGGGTCSGEYEEDTVVTLTATPAAHTEVQWSGCELVVGQECIVTVGAADTGVTATFTTIKRKLTVAKSGSGSGSVSCDGGACATEYDEGSTVTLAATPASGSSFAGWSGGGCSGTAACEVTLGTDTTVTASFTANPSPPPATCANTPSLCPPPVVNPPVNPKPPVIKCKKGFKKKKVKGKVRCVKVKKKHGHRHH